MKLNKLIAVLIVILLIGNFSSYSQISIPIKRDTIKVKFSGIPVFLPIQGTANVSTLNDEVNISLIAELYLSDLEKKLLNVLKKKYEKKVKCGSSVILYDAILKSKNNKLQLNLDLRPKYKQCDFPNISTNHRGDLLLELTPFIEKKMLGVRAQVISHDLGIFLDYFIDEEKFILVEENIPKSFARHEFTLVSAKTINSKNGIIVITELSGKFTPEELGQLIQSFGKSD